MNIIVFIVEKNSHKLAPKIQNKDPHNNKYVMWPFSFQCKCQNVTKCVIHIEVHNKSPSHV